MKIHMLIFAIIATTIFSCKPFDATKMKNEFESEIQKTDTEMYSFVMGTQHVYSVEAMKDHAKPSLRKLDASIKKIEDYKVGGIGGVDFKSKTVEYLKSKRKLIEIYVNTKNYPPVQDAEIKKLYEDLFNVDVESKEKFSEFLKAQEVFIKENGIK